MEDVLDSDEAEDPLRPHVGFAYTYQLLGTVRGPLPVRPGQGERYDYKSRREGTCNPFLFFQPHTGWRHVKVIDRRTKQDFAQCMKDLVDVHFPKAEVVRAVLDPLDIHKPVVLYETFLPDEAWRIIPKFESHHTPKHGSWLNMAEIQLSVLSNQSLGRHLADSEVVCCRVPGRHTITPKERRFIGVLRQKLYELAHASINHINVVRY